MTVETVAGPDIHQVHVCTSVVHSILFHCFHGLDHSQMADLNLASRTEVCSHGPSRLLRLVRCDDDG